MGKDSSFSRGLILFIVFDGGCRGLREARVHQGTSLQSHWIGKSRTKRPQKRIRVKLFEIYTVYSVGGLEEQKGGYSYALGSHSCQQATGFDPSRCKTSQNLHLGRRWGRIDRRGT